MWKSLVLLVLIAAPLQAQTVNVTAVTLHLLQPPIQPGGPEHVAEIHMNAQMTLAKREGTYWLPWLFDVMPKMTEYAITAISGTLRVDCAGAPGCSFNHTYIMSAAPKTEIQGDAPYFSQSYIAEYIPFTATAAGSTAHAQIFDNHDWVWLQVREGKNVYTVPIGVQVKP